TYTLVDPATKSSRPMFDHDKIAAALKDATKGAFKADGRHLPVSDPSLSDQDHTLTLSAAGTTYRCDLTAQPVSCKAISQASGWPVDPDHKAPTPPITLSPDKKSG